MMPPHHRRRCRENKMGALALVSNSDDETSVIQTSVSGTEINEEWLARGMCVGEEEEVEAESFACFVLLFFRSSTQPWSLQHPPTIQIYREREDDATNTVPLLAGGSHTGRRGELPTEHSYLLLASRRRRGGRTTSSSKTHSSRSVITIILRSSSNPALNGIGFG